MTQLEQLPVPLLLWYRDNARVLPWRRPECITGAGSLQASGGAGGCAGSVPHREPDGEGPGIY